MDESATAARIGSWLELGVRQTTMRLMLEIGRLRLGQEWVIPSPVGVGIPEFEQQARGFSSALLRLSGWRVISSKSAKY